MTYLLDCWYLAAWEHELPAGGHLVRTIAEKPLLLLRDGNGGVSALLNRCPHRFAPLSRGWIEEDKITCGYHGIVFDHQGRCLANPHGPVVSALTVPSYPIALKHNGVWVWLGDAKKADRDLLPDLSVMHTLPPVAQNFGYQSIRANYLLCVDNILDSSHVDYLHADSLGGGATTRAKRTISEEGDQIILRWLAKNDVAPPVLAVMMDDKDKPKPIDLHLSVEWTAPSAMLLTFGLVLSEKPELGGPDTWSIHIMTPIDARTTHYFFWNGRNGMWDEHSNAIVRETIEHAFANEDKPMLEAQQETIGDADFEALRPVLLRTDEGPMRVRRRLRQMLESERAEHNRQGETAPA